MNKGIILWITGVLFIWLGSWSNPWLGIGIVLLALSNMLYTDRQTKNK